MAQNQSQQYKITEASIKADRLGNIYDVTSSIAEFNVFESLDKPYLTGQVAILDDKSLFDIMNFQGTERFSIRIASVENDLDSVFERTFIMTSLEKSVKSNNNAKSSLNVFTLIEEHAYLARAKKISRSFNGKIDDTLVKLIGKEMRKNIDTSYMQGSVLAQQSIKGIIPNLTILEALKWLTSRATTDTGSPFFTYASMHDENIRLGNLEVMLQQTPWNDKIPYTYNPSNVSLADSQSEFEKTFIIKAVKTAKMSNTLKLVEQGLVSSQYSNTNLNTAQIFNQPYSIRNTLKRMENRNVIGKNQNVFDKDFFLSEQQSDLYESRRFHTITSSGTYGNTPSYNDEFQEPLFRKKIESMSLKGHLYKNMLNVVIEGAGFIVAKATVGDVVRMNIINDNAEIQKDIDERTALDKRLSGKFIIYDTRHTFQGTQHTVSMNVCKLERDNA